MCFSTLQTKDKKLNRVKVNVTRQNVPPLILNPVPSQSGPSSARSSHQDNDGERKSVASTTGRSSLNDTTTAPTSARSVSFKEPVIDQAYDPPASTSTGSTNDAQNSVLHGIGMSNLCEP